MSDTRFFLSLLAFARSPGQAGGRALVFSYATLLLFRRAQRPFSGSLHEVNACEDATLRTIPPPDTHTHTHAHTHTASAQSAAPRIK